VATIGSCILIAVGLVATVARGMSLFDIDLAGGTSATMILKKPLDDGDVRRMLGETFENLKDSGAPGRIDYTVYEITFKGRDERTVYQVLSNIPKVEVLQKAIQETFRNDDGSEGLLTYQLEVGNLKPVTRASDVSEDSTGVLPGGPGPFESTPPTKSLAALRMKRQTR
jgi:SecD/SecF fusion protein